MTSINPYAGGFDDRGSPAPPQRTGKLAVASLTCSLILCCPIATIVAPLLGLLHFAVAAGKPWIRGGGLAIAGIVLGIVFSGFWIWGGWQTARAFQTMSQLPSDAMAALSQNDLQAFREAAQGITATEADDEVVLLFAEEVEDRFGTFVEASFDFTQTPPPGRSSQEFVLPYRMFFRSETGSMNEVVAMVYFRPEPLTGQPLVSQFELRGPDGRVLVFPGVEESSSSGGTDSPDAATSGSDGPITDEAGSDAAEDSSGS